MWFGGLNKKKKKNIPLAYIQVTEWTASGLKTSGQILFISVTCAC